jgi:carboxyl-terminal processing protease
VTIRKKNLNLVPNPSKAAGTLVEIFPQKNEKSKAVKKIILIFILIGSQFGFSQELKEIEKLSSLCKTWGFLKYYHPNVSKGDYNWDEQLLIILPKVEQAKNREELSKVYLDWIESLGTVKVCKTCNELSDQKYFDKNFDLSWTQSTESFTDELTNKLEYIENNRFQGNSYYVTSTNIGNIEIKNEPKYDNFAFPNENYRLLSLFKFWNTVEYFYPYKYLTNQNWNKVLNEMIPKFISAKNATEYHLAMLEAVVKLDDSHGIFKTKFTTEYFGTKFIPAKLKIMDDKAIVTGFYNDSLSKINDLRIGDIIENVNEKSIKDILNEKLKYIAGSNLNSKLTGAYYTIANGNSDSLSISVNRNGKLYDKIIYRYPFDLIFKKNIKNEKYKILENNIGYIDMAALEMKDVDETMKKLENTKAIIIDIRNYPNFIPYSIANYLNSEKKPFLKTNIPDLKYPGKFIWEEYATAGKNNKEYFKGKVVLLVNEETQSRAEYSVMCLQTANNVITIGSQTAGADGNISYIEFIGGNKSLMSGTGIYYPDGTITQRKGVKVDIEILPTIKGIQDGKDEVLEKAIEIIRTEK